MSIKDPQAFIAERKKALVITDLIANEGYDLGQAEKFWDEHGKGQAATGFTAAFHSALIEKILSEKQVQAFIKEHGTANTLRHESSYQTLAKFATELRKSLAK